MKLKILSRKLISAGVLVAALATLAFVDNGAHAATPADGAKVQVQSGPSAPVQAWSQAVQAGDSAALLRMNTGTTVAFPPDAMVKRGGRDIVAGYTGMFEKFDAAVQISDAHYIESAGLVHSWGLYKLTLTPKTGAGGAEPLVINGRFSDIATQVNGQWQYIMDHASVPAGK